MHVTTAGNFRRNIAGPPHGGVQRDAGFWFVQEAQSREKHIASGPEFPSLDRGRLVGLVQCISLPIPSMQERELTQQDPDAKFNLHHWTEDREVTGRNSHFVLHHWLHLVGTRPRISGISLLLISTGNVTMCDCVVVVAAHPNGETPGCCAV